jgi:hypothetical protein
MVVQNTAMDLPNHHMVSESNKIYMTKKSSLLEGQHYMNTEYDIPKTTISKLDSRAVE